ncbi:electron carrier/iron ion binding protein [Gossypium australe]|uniref:Electron carrier/iron ion binding protein n=1 Tax=Gossypium australe TaxID=47621 RepID=A0A5B6U8C7_9ROSI|nr:electron carrier/iron ion binding protein [Gossypium australe]
MAASSPAVTKSISETTTAAIKSTTTTATAAAAGVTATPLPPPPFQRMDTPPKTQRGLNKPKCIQCGNVARSRCPYRSCKSCCSKAQNPCHIHVLKSNSAFSEKTPSSSTPPSDQKSTQASSQATPLRVPSFRQLSNAFAQFDNLHVRTKKHLTRKDAVALNEWRFSKLKEFKDRNIEIENDAFDRYMQNISLLEEVFSTKPMQDGSDEDEESKPSSTSQEDKTLAMTSGLKLALRSNPVRSDNTRKRILQIVDQGIKKLQKSEPNNGATDPDDQNKLDNRLKKAKPLWVERSLMLSDIMDKLNKARNEEDLKSCLEMKAQLYNQSTVSTPTEIKDHDTLNEQDIKNDTTPRKVGNYPMPKLFASMEIDQETLNKVDAHFSSLEQIEDL